MNADDPLTDDDAVGRALSGDLGAYETLVSRYTAIAHRTAFLLGAGNEAEDVVQEAFVKAYRHLKSFRRDSAFRPWLLRIVANETHNATRSGAAGRPLRPAGGCGSRPARRSAGHGGGGRPVGAAARGGPRLCLIGNVKRWSAGTSCSCPKRRRRRSWAARSVR